MPEDAPRPAQAAIRTELGAIFVSLELSRRTWLVTSLSPGGGEKMSKHSVPGSEVSVERHIALLSCILSGSKGGSQSVPRLWRGAPMAYRTGRWRPLMVKIAQWR